MKKAEEKNFWVSKSLEETRAIAAEIFFNLEKSTEAATVIGLQGELGSGKTTFVQQLGQVLEIQENITSPTFILMKIYDLTENKKGFKKLFHLDAYRLKSGQELLSLGLQPELNNPENLFVIEWCSRVVDILPADFLTLHFEVINEYTRTIEARNNLPIV